MYLYICIYVLYICKYARAPERNWLRRSQAKADERVVVIAEHNTQKYDEQYVWNNSFKPCMYLYMIIILIFTEWMHTVVCLRVITTTASPDGRVDVRLVQQVRELFEGRSEKTFKWQFQ